MKVGRDNLRSVRGFTLVELLLVVALVALLFGAVVFNFASLQNTADLTEGTTRVEALLLFVRSQAQYTGRRLTLRFEREVDSPSASPTKSSPIQVLWEPDPLTLPGRWEVLSEASQYLQNLTDLVRVVRVRVGDSPEPLVPGEPPPVDETPSVDLDGHALENPPVHFFPDGSSDSLELELVSRRPEDRRKIRLRLEGITGALHREFVESEPSVDAPDELEEDEQMLESEEAR